jgi:hypothetical protein
MTDSILFKSEIENLNGFENLKDMLKMPKMSISANIMLDIWYHRIKVSFKRFSQQKETIMSSLNSEDTLTKISDFSAIPEPLRVVINKVCVNNHSFSIEIPYNGKKRRIKIYICAPSHFTSTKIRKMVSLISTWFYFVNDFVENGCSDTIDIYLYLIPNKKSLPDHGDAIDMEDVNTAFTTTCAIKTNVHIFREEEWFRALIHESFHNLGLDFIRMDNTMIHAEQARIAHVFNTKMPDIRFYETYCEMWAEVLNLMFYVHINKAPSISWKVEFFRLLKYEQAFSLLQCVKLLKHNGISYQTFPENGHKYSEETNGFSYYILKCILSVHLDEFLHFCSSQFAQDEYSLQFRRTSHNLKKYTNLILRNHKSGKMIQGTKFMETCAASEKLGETLRMSLFEIKI